MGHPWAGSPLTLGSLSIMYLSILFIRFKDVDESNFYEEE